MVDCLIAKFMGQPSHASRHHYFGVKTVKRKPQSILTAIMTSSASAVVAKPECLDLARTARLNNAFVHEYRSTALKWATYACLAGALLFISFLAIAWSSHSHAADAQYLRLGLAGSLLGLAGLLWRQKGVTTSNYVTVAAVGSTFTLAGTIAILLLSSQDAQISSFQAAPSFIFGLFLHYTFLRLPLSLAAAIGWTMSAAAVAWAPESISGSNTARHAVYLSFANAFGMIICHLIETRERGLFFERSQAESAKSEARERQVAAEEVGREKTRLIAAVSHDLRQPMMAAVAYVSNLRYRIDRGDIDGARDQASKVESAVGVLGTTLDHLLTAARYDSGTEPIKLELVELGPMLWDLHEAYIAEARERGVELRVRIPKGRVVLTTDRRSLYRVLSNLVSNAVKFSKPHFKAKSKVLISGTVRAGTCRVSVYDRGIGISSESQVEIWKPYVQLNNIERDRERGLGLGLFLVQRIVEQLPLHRIEMRSVLGQGSTFTLAMPGALVGSNSVVNEDYGQMLSREALAPLRGAYALLLEDDLDARLAITDLLEEWGVDVTSGSSAKDVLSANVGIERLVDVIVCDYRLSGGDNGIEAIERIRSSLGYVPHALLITGEAVVEEVRLNTGIYTTVLHKPFRIELFSALLLKAVKAVRDLEA
jgi:signal transduction histidine kinase/CheY-like chemotaxis protein